MELKKRIALGKLKDELMVRPESYGPPEIDSQEIALEEFLGEGTYGRVYKGRCRGTSVAVKVPRHQNLTEKEIKEFRAEVAIMSQIFHPNVVLFMGACTQPGDIKIVTEIMDRDLDFFIHESGKAKTVSMFIRMKMAKGAAKGMSWLHGINNIIHRDLKPANLLMDINNNVKVTDFGFSQILKGNKTMKDKDVAKGSALWMSPELLKNEEFDKSVDVYAFGIILWEIYTLKEPWEEEGIHEWKQLVEAVVTHNQRPKMPPDILPSLSELIQECWHPDRQKRCTFPDIVFKLDQVMVDLAIEEPSGGKFWKEYFLVHELEEAIEWKDFGLALSDSTSVQYSAFNILKPYLVDKEDKVTLESFNTGINWFGESFFQGNEKRVEESLSQILFLISQEWFFGFINQAEADGRLGAHHHDGTFLVRLSKTMKEFPYTLSFVVKQEVKHMRIRKTRAPIRFVWRHGGQQVSLVGTFSQWNPICMTKKDNLWITEFVLDSTIHEYFFIVDSKGCCDSDQPMAKDLEGNIRNIHYPGAKEYLFSVPGQMRNYTSLTDLIEGITDEVGLRTPCPRTEKWSSYM